MNYFNFNNVEDNDILLKIAKYLSSNLKRVIAVETLRYILKLGGYIAMISNIGVIKGISVYFLLEPRKRYIVYRNIDDGEDESFRYPKNEKKYDDIQLDEHCTMKMIASDDQITYGYSWVLDYPRYKLVYFGIQVASVKFVPQIGVKDDDVASIVEVVTNSKSVVDTCLPQLGHILGVAGLVMPDSYGYSGSHYCTLQSSSMLDFIIV